MTSAKVIADSISGEGHRVTTMEVTLHRFVLAEFNTHRVFSRNSASSRAIPFAKQVERVISNPAMPVTWATEQKGMQGGDPLERARQSEAERHWLSAREAAITQARKLATLGVHKSVVNRLLEPFMWHTVIVTSVEWDNFFEQRISPLAQPEIHAAAYWMKHALDRSTPDELAYGEWHTPYIDPEDEDAIATYMEDNGVPSERHEFYRLDQIARQVSAARCARVSYLTHDGVRSIEKDLELYQKLVTAQPPHHSPLEHVCTPASRGEIRAGEVMGNLYGWYQLRHNTDNPKYMR